MFLLNLQCENRICKTMTQEEKQLLLKDICARSLYGVKIQIGSYSDYKLIGVVLADKKPVKVELEGQIIDISVENIKPHLRPMSSMTEEEKLKYITLTHYNTDDDGKPYRELTIESIDWLNTHHFDYRGLIEKGLALEDKEGVYKV